MARLRNAICAVKTHLWPRRITSVSPTFLIIWMAVVAILFAAAALLWFADHRHDQVADAKRASVDAAQNLAAEVISYDHRTVDEDMKRAQDSLTGKFRDDYAQLTAQVITPAAKTDEITTKAEVKSAGVVHAEPDTAKVLLFVNQTTTSKKISEPKVDNSRLEVTMQRVNGRWLVSELVPL